MVSLIVLPVTAARKIKSTAPTKTHTAGKKVLVGKSKADIKKEERRQKAAKIQEERRQKAAKANEERLQKALAREKKRLQSITDDLAKDLEAIEPFFGKSSLTDEEEDTLKSKLKRLINRRHVNAKERGFESFGRVLFNVPSVSKLYPYIHFERELREAKQSAKNGLRKQQFHARKVTKMGCQVPDLLKEFKALIDKIEFLDKQFHLLFHENLTQ